MMAVGGAVAGIVVLWLPVPTWISVMAGGIALVASLPTFPLVLKVVAKRLIRIFQRLLTRVLVGDSLLQDGRGRHCPGCLLVPRSPCWSPQFQVSQ